MITAPGQRPTEVYADPLAKLAAGPVQFAYSGWAFVDILEGSTPTPDDDFFITYNHPFSFESDSWLRAGKQTDVPVCIMNSGYSSGWCEESYGVPLSAGTLIVLSVFYFGGWLA